MSLNVSELLESGAINHSECIQCGACCDACRKDALKLSFGRMERACERYSTRPQNLAQAEAAAQGIDD